MSAKVKQIAVGAGAIALCGGLALVLLPMMVDREGIKQQIIRQVADKAHLSLSVASNPEVQLWPSPTLTFHEVKAVPQNAADGIQPLMTASAVQVQLGWGGIFTGAALPDEVKLVQPRIQLPALGGDKLSWPDLFSVISGQALPMNMVIEGGTLLVEQNEKPWAENITGSWRHEGQQALAQAQFSLSGKAHTLTLQAPTLNATDSALPVMLDVKSDAGHVTFSGEVKGTGDDRLTQGKITVETQDIWNFSTYWKADAVTSTGGKEPLAVKLSGDVFHKSGNVVIKDMAVKGGETDGKISSSFSFESPYNLQLRGEFESLDVANLLSLKWFAMRDVGQALSEESAQHMSGRAVIQAKALKGAFRGSNLSLLVDMANGALKISDVRMQTEGQGRLIFQGDVTPSVQGPALSGNVSGDGQAFHEFLPSVMAVPFTLPKIGFGPYVFAASLRLTPEDLRVSDFRARVENTLFNGAYIEQFEKNDAGIRLAIANLNLDDVLNAQASDAMKFMYKDDKGIEQAYLLPPYIRDMLLNLTATNTLNLQIQDYTYNGTPRDPVDMELVSARGQATLKRLSGRFNGAVFNISGSVNVIATTPQAKLYVSADDIDVERFKSTAEPSAEPTAELSSVPAQNPVETKTAKWSNQPLNWNFIPRTESEVKIALGKIRNPLFSASDVKASLKVTDGQIFLNEATASVWETGQLKMKGQLSGGSLPQFKMGLSLGNVELAQARTLIPWLENIAGRVSFTASLDSHGASALALAQNATGSLALTGRGIQLSQFDLKGAAQAIRQAASADDLSPTFDRILPASNTSFDTLEANAFLQNGTIRLPQALLRSASYQGVLKGEGSVIDWSAKSAIEFPLPELVLKNPPVLGFTFQGTLDKLDVSRNLQSVQAYVADSTARKLIEKKPAPAQ